MKKSKRKTEAVAPIPALPRMLDTRLTLPLFEPTIRVGDVIVLDGIEQMVVLVNETRAKCVPVSRRHTQFTTVGGKSIEFYSLEDGTNISPCSTLPRLARLGIEGLNRFLGGAQAAASSEATTQQSAATKDKTNMKTATVAKDKTTRRGGLAAEGPILTGAPPIKTEKIDDKTIADAQAFYAKGARNGSKPLAPPPSPLVSVHSALKSAANDRLNKEAQEQLKKDLPPAALNSSLEGDKAFVAVCKDQKTGDVKRVSCVSYGNALKAVGTKFPGTWTVTATELNGAKHDLDAVPAVAEKKANGTGGQNDRNVPPRFKASPFFAEAKFKPNAKDRFLPTPDTALGRYNCRIWELLHAGTSTLEEIVEVLLKEFKGDKENTKENATKWVSETPADMDAAGITWALKPSEPKSKEKQPPIIVGKANVKKAALEAAMAEARETSKSKKGKK